MKRRPPNPAFFALSEHGRRHQARVIALVGLVPVALLLGFVIGRLT